MRFMTVALLLAACAGTSDDEEKTGDTAVKDTPGDDDETSDTGKKTTDDDPVESETTGDTGGTTTKPPSGTVIFSFDEKEPPLLRGDNGLTLDVVQDPDDAANDVLRLARADDAKSFAAAIIWDPACSSEGIAPIPFTATDNQIFVRVWSPSAGTPFLLKVEDKFDPGVAVEVTASTTVAKTWEWLTFTFTGGAEPDLKLDYDRLILFPNFGTKGKTAGAETFFVDDIIFSGPKIDTVCRPTTFEIGSDFDDTWIGWFLDAGSLGLGNPADGGAQMGNAAAGAAFVMPFELPSPLPAGGFTSANLKVNLIDAVLNNDKGALDINGDLYGLDFRTAADVKKDGAVILDQFHADDTPDAKATLIVDNFLNSSIPDGSDVETDKAADKLLVDYINGEVTKGAVAGDFIYLRISPDVDTPVGAGHNYVVGASFGPYPPANRPILTVE